MVYWVYFTINSSNQSILPLQLIAIVRVCKKKNNRHVFLLIADGCAHIIRSLDARFQVITENIISFFSPIQHIWANEGLCLLLQTHCFSANAAPETFASRPRGGRVTSQRRLRLLPDSPTGIGSLLSGCSFLERAKKKPKAQKRFGLSFFLGL